MMGETKGSMRFDGPIMAGSIPKAARDLAAYWFGDALAADPRFWSIAEREGLDELIRQFSDFGWRVIDGVIEKGGRVSVEAMVLPSPSRGNQETGEPRLAFVMHRL